MDPDAQDKYKELIEKLLEECGKISDLDQVLEVCENISGLKVDSEGKLIEGASKNNFRNLVACLNGKIGPMVNVFAKKAILESDIDNELVKELPYGLKGE